MSAQRRILILILILISLPIIWIIYKYLHFFAYIGIKQLPSQIENYQTVRYGSSNADKEKTTNILFLGDSLTAGVGASSFQNSYPNLLAQELTTILGNIQSTNYAFPGDKTQDMLDRQLEQDLADPQVVFVLIGINDIFDHVGTTKFEYNYQQIVDQLKQKTASQIILLTIPNITTSSLVGWPLDHYYHNQIKSYNQIIARVATANNLELLDLYSLTEDSPYQIKNYYSSDLFHPSDQGYNKWADVLTHAYINCQSCLRN